MRRYRQLAEEISHQIRAGVLRSGERIPSVRQSRRSHRMSPATVMQAYRLLESRGEINARPRSGYYVSPRWAGIPLEPRTFEPPKRAASVDKNDFIFEILHSLRDPKMVQLGSPFMDAEMFPLAKLARYLSAAARRLNPQLQVECLPPGHAELRRGIARRYLRSGIAVKPEDIVITNGGLEALMLGIRAVARAGDVVAIESPAFYAQLQAAQLYGLKALQIATSPVEGIDLSALSGALNKHRVKACWLMTSFQNPTGALMPEEKKKDLVRLLAKHDVPLIEDDVNEELYFTPEKPRPAKAFDRSGLVLHCSSFSKSLGPGYRVGWMLPGRYRENVERDKWMTTLTTSMQGQAGMSEYLKLGGYDHHLRKLREALATQRDQMLHAVRRFFPAQTRATQPGRIFPVARAAGIRSRPQSASPGDGRPDQRGAGAAVFRAGRLRQLPETQLRAAMDRARRARRGGAGQRRQIPVNSGP
jgi:DNA-binding transcriptional MocR family regulator